MLASYLSSLIDYESMTTMSDSCLPSFSYDWFVKQISEIFFQWFVAAYSFIFAVISRFNLALLMFLHGRVALRLDPDNHKAPSQTIVALIGLNGVNEALTCLERFQIDYLTLLSMMDSALSVVSG